MNKYFLKYIKYKSKYINYIINYGGTTPPVTPEKNRVIPATPGSTDPQPATPAFIKPQTVPWIIEHVDDFVCKLKSCCGLNMFTIKSKNTYSADPDLYINFNLKRKQFAHLSFHKNTEYEEPLSHFDLAQFHLRVDGTNPPIFFNIEHLNGRLVLVPIQLLCDIQQQLGLKQFEILQNIINCIEEILNSSEYYKHIIEPVATKLTFD